MGHTGITTDFDRAAYAIFELAKQCMESSSGERPEVTWLKSVYEKQRRQLSLSKAQMDALLYQRITGHPPVGPEDTLKIRYWRTGHHVPINRRVCALFGTALQLTEKEQQYLIQGYLDKSLTLYDTIPSENDAEYWSRRAALETLVASYLKRAPRVKAPTNNFRHLYYMDALRYIHQTGHPAQPWDKHIYSVRYDMELQRNLKLLGEIPRKTMLRHLLILGMPDISLSLINEQLALFGYLPLSADHTMTGGEQLDRLLIGLIESYEELRKEKKAPDSGQWFCRCCQELDALFQNNKKNSFRFMYFKSLE